MKLSLLKQFIIIPSFKPTSALTELVTQLSLRLKSQQKENLVGIIIVNDGNLQNLTIWGECKSIYDNLIVLHHAKNLGKGRGLKFAFNYVLTHFENLHSVVTADADGQHSVTDIINVLDEVFKTNFDLVLGVREFDQSTPLRSLIGNKLTSLVFQFLVGLKLKDTQTGLRALNKKSIEQSLDLEGERYEYETNMLLAAQNFKWKIKELPIQTIYIENNKSSHFNPIFDSMKIYFLIFRFASASLASSVVDIFVFSFCINAGINIFKATLIARFISGWINFYLNFKVVFKGSENIKLALLKYWSLVVFMGSISSIVVSELNKSFEHPIFLKLITESVLFLISFSLQKEFIFFRSQSKE